MPTMVAPVPPEAEAPKQMVMAPDGMVLSAFIMDFAFVTIIRGPWGSGKSAGCVGKLFYAANLQEPDHAGVRRTRWAIVRNSYPDLQETTIKTWLEWFPEEMYGQMRRSRPFQHVIRVAGMPDSRGRPTSVEMEVLFLALDDENDRKKLLSMELTGAWINEAREISKAIIDDIIGRTGRFPAKRMGGCSWAGLIMDTNAPNERHWLPIMMEEVVAPEDMSEEERDSLKKPENWNYYVQPGALLEIKDGDGRVTGYEPNPLAENIKHLNGGHKYYLERVGGKTRSWIRVNFCNLLGQLVQGKPVWPTFERGRHVASKPIPFDPHLALHVGIDSTGRSPAAIFGQVLDNRWRIIGELIGRDTTAEQFAPAVRRKIALLIHSSGIAWDRAVKTFTRDPHMEQSQIDDQTVDMVFRKFGMRLVPAPGGNGIKHRIETVDTIIEHGRILISPTCTTLIAACEGGYHFRKLRVTGSDIYDEEPNKNAYSNPADGLQYLLLGAGEGREMMRGSERAKAVKTATRYKPGENRRDLWRQRASA